MDEQQWLQRVKEEKALAKDQVNRNSIGVLSVTCPECMCAINMDQEGGCACGNTATSEEVTKAHGLENVPGLTATSVKRRD